MLTQRSSIAEVREKLLKREQFHPFPKYGERQAWEGLPAPIREFYLKLTDEVLDFEIPNLPATYYMDFYRTGLASRHQALTRMRREMLLVALLAECIEGRGRLIDKIIDIVWAICEESSWVDPHHNNHMHNHMWSGVVKNPLPDVTNINFVDLTAGNTAAVLTWVYYFLRERLDQETPMICRRIAHELNRRIVEPFMKHDDLTWFGWYGHKINNWNPWILSNIMPLALIVMKDEEQSAEYIARAMEKLDIYVEDCKQDGGCDEGPGYWFAAGGMLFDCMEELRLFTGGRLDFFGELLMKNVGEYIVKANVRGTEYVNFADNRHSVVTDGALLYRFGKRIRSDRLTAFALQHFDMEQVASRAFTSPFRLLEGIFGAEEAAGAARIPHVPQDDWLPDTQLLYVRSQDGRLTAAAKGGFNNESHNHNDLGHFICSWEGKQFIVDLGAPTYTAKVWGPQRYEVWILQSGWHNCAKLGGFDQHDGDQYRAQVISCEMDEQKAALALQLKGAYEAEAGIESYVRTLTMDKEHAVWTVTDDVKMADPSEIEFHFITVRKPSVRGGAVTIPVDDGHEAEMTFDAEKLDCAVEEWDLTQETTEKDQEWGSKTAYRIHLTAKGMKTECRSEVSIRVREK